MFGASIVADPTWIRHDSGQAETSPAWFQGTSDHRTFQLCDSLPVGERAKRLLRRLIRRDPPQPVTGKRKSFCWVKVRGLAEELSVSESTVHRGLRELTRWNLIRRDLRDQLKIWINYSTLRQLTLSPVTLRDTPVTIFDTPCYDSCPGCGRAIAERKSAKRRYHSAACRMRAYRRRRRGKSASVLKKYEALRFVTPPTKTKTLKQHNDDIRTNVDSEYVRSLRHPKLHALCRRQEQLKQLFQTFNPDRVLRAISQADLQYRSPNGIHNAYGLIYAMCRNGLDDDLLREREEQEHRRRQRLQRERKLRELQARGCLRCGWWDVGFDGYCYECKRSAVSAQLSADSRELTAIVKNAGISSEGGLDPPLMVFDSAALKASEKPPPGRGLPPAFPRLP